MPKQRLSITLLWKLLAKFQNTEEYETAQIGDFLDFVESEMKSTKRAPKVG